ncbi:hypothetical protein NMG60_11001631 [Bertholletia excelsa]
MLAFSPSLFPTLGWPLEDPTCYQLSNIYRESVTHSDQSFLHSPPSQPLSGHAEVKISSEIAADSAAAKKLNHNASERDRRKKINSLFSSLRTLLPATDQTKKLSIPATVSGVVKYIPELQREVERLVQKKEELMSRVFREKDPIHYQKHSNCTATPCSKTVVSASLVGDNEVVIQICTLNRVEKSTPLSEVLQNLEDDGLLLLHASSFHSFGERVFCNLHLQVIGNTSVECDMIREKLLLLYAKKD